MEKSIRLFWYQSSQGFNFGDELGPYIINKLSGKPIKRIMVLKAGNSILKDLAIITVGIIKKRYNISIVKEYIRGKLHPDFIVSIGSILHHNFPQKARIWGSGIIDQNSNVKESRFYAVRGYETVKRLEELSYEIPTQIGDPALLLPVVYKPQHNKKKYKIGVIPHVSHLRHMQKFIKDDPDILLIDFSQDNIEKTVDLINSCQSIFSSSLHGLIVSHAYEIPALHVTLGPELSGDGIKFKDYFSSVNIRPYDAISFQSLNINDKEELLDLFIKHDAVAVPQQLVIQNIKRGLLNEAPFDIHEKYKGLIT